MSYESQGSMNAACASNWIYYSPFIGTENAVVEETIDRDPVIWGPGRWAQLHMMAFSYPIYPTSVQQAQMYRYIQSIPQSLPCRVCRQHASEYLKSHEKDVQWATESQKNLFILFVNFHNDVNKRLGKRTYTFQDAYDIWSSTS